ncbi:hypothetical protein CK203_100919 [Vitis vinifera]|uniref:Uncharacterized protein n=1 Tax=Vitis vinifera TaxID=29760 RepID=A0A438CJC5_VITVI|nr:hypothetical protein CK203_100919 [Vitis vinifera]
MPCSLLFRLSFLSYSPGTCSYSALHAFWIGSWFLVWIYLIWIRVEGRLIQFFLERSDMDQRVVTVDQFTTAMASIQEASASPRQEIDSQQSRQFVVQDETPCDSLPHLPPPLGSTMPRAPPYMLHGHFEVVSPAYTSGQSTIQVQDADIERYMVVGCLYTYLRLYSTVMRAHGLDGSQMITMFPLSLSEVSRRELEGLRQRSDEFISSFVSHRQGKIAEIVDRPL